MSDKKNSYFNIFYGINLSLIKKTFKKCELFIQKIKNEEENKENEKAGLSIDSEKEELSSDNELNKNNSKKGNKHSVEDKNATNKKYNNIKKINNFTSSFDYRIFHIKTVIFEIFIIIFFIIMLLLYFSFTSNYKAISQYDYHMQHLYNNYIDLFNTYREYLFDSGSIVNNTNCYKYLSYKENDIYETANEDFFYIKNNVDKIEGLKEKYNEFYKRDICSRINNDYFKNIEECYSFMEGGTSLEIRPFLSFFVETLRIQRTKINSFFEKEQIYGNLTKIPYLNWKTENKIDGKSQKFVSYLLIDTQGSKEISVAFSQLLLPYIEEEKSFTLTYIKDTVNKEHIVFIILISLYFICIIIVFIFIWFPLIKEIKNTLYKTKNMISIIPIQIFILQPNITLLLNIQDKNIIK